MPMRLRPVAARRLVISVAAPRLSIPTKAAAPRSAWVADEGRRKPELRDQRA